MKDSDLIRQTSLLWYLTSC